MEPLIPNYYSGREFSALNAIPEVRKAEEQQTIQNMLDIKREQEKQSQNKYARLTQSQWREIDALWESGDITVKQLVERYKKHPDTFVNHFRKYGIKKGAKAAELARIAAEQAKAKTRQEADIVSERIHKTKEDHYKMAEAISRLTFNEILKAKQEEKEFKAAKENIKTLLLAAETLKKCREERWIVLGLDKDVVDEDALPELVMSTMTEEQVRQLREAQIEDEEMMGLDDDLIQAAN